MALSVHEYSRNWRSFLRPTSQPATLRFFPCPTSCARPEGNDQNPPNRASYLGRSETPACLLREGNNMHQGRELSVLELPGTPPELSSGFALKNNYVFIFREGKGGRGEKHQCVVASHVPPPGDLGHNPGMCPDWESNQRPFGSQASAQSTEPHQPRLFLLLR